MPAASVRDEKAEFERFFKFFCIKSIQAVSHARVALSSSAPPAKSASDPKAQHWFNLDIPDVPSVQGKARTFLDRQLPSAGRSLVIQVSLPSPDQDRQQQTRAASPEASAEGLGPGQGTRVIEAWKISHSDETDRTAKIFSGVYSKLVLLLKSVLTVSRCTPAYKLCRRQNMSLHVDFYLGEVSPSLLNEECERPRRLGSVKTPYGSIAVSLLCKSMQQIDFSTPQFSSVQSMGAGGGYLHEQGGTVVSSQTNALPQSQPHTFPIRAAFASKPKLKSEELMSDMPLESLLLNVEPISPAQTTTTETTPMPQDTSDALAVDTSQDVRRKSEPNLSFKPKPSFLVSSHVHSSENQPAFASSISEQPPRDVHQFFRIVEHAGCLRSHSPPEGDVISHNMPLSDYITSFAVTQLELSKLTEDL